MPSAPHISCYKGSNAAAVSKTSTCCDAMWCLTAANLHWQRHQRTPQLAWRCRVRFVTGGVKALLNLPACCSELTVGGQAFDDGSVCFIA
jgi:hypothetical protein